METVINSLMICCWIWRHEGQEDSGGEQEWGGVENLESGMSGEGGRRSLFVWDNQGKMALFKGRFVKILKKNCQNCK